MSLAELAFRLRFVASQMPARDRAPRLVLVVIAVSSALTIAVGTVTWLLVVVLAASVLGVVVAAGELVLLAVDDDNFEIIPPDEHEGEGW